LETFEVTWVVLGKLIRWSVRVLVRRLGVGLTGGYGIGRLNGG
jgi:hypothetical protein